MTSQQLHDQQFKGGVTFTPGSRHLLEKMLEEKSEKPQKLTQQQYIDPIEWALKRHPGLTREEAEAIVAMQGF